MKKSKTINIDMMRKTPRKVPRLGPLAVAIAAITLTACSSKQEAVVVESVDDCVTKTTMTLEQCDSAYKSALAEAERTAPKYRSRSQCEAEFGYSQCQTTRSGGMFMPFMAGYLVSQVMSNRGGYYGGTYNPVFHYQRPYSSHNNRIMTADGTVIGRAGQSSYRVGKSSFKPKPKVTRTVSRGGFGSVASAKSSWGGGKRSGGWGG